MGERPEPAARALSSDEPFVGDERFEIRSRLGVGGMGVVYEAFDRERDAVVALKALPGLDGDTLLRFKHEFRAVHDIKHPNLVELGELMERQGRWLITMELVRGVDLVSWVRGTRPSARHLPSSPSDEDEDETRVLAQGRKPEPGSISGEHARVRPPPPVPRAFDEGRLRSALVQLCRGVLALHAANKVHRDLKPSNILVTEAGTVKILDFGLVAEAGTARSPNESEFVVGTPNYMAPEQAMGGVTGPEADWYSVGVVLFVALTGGPPFVGTANEVMIAKHLESPVRALDVPPDLDAICSALLAREPVQRATGRDVLALLGEEADEEVAPLSSEVVLDEFVGRTNELALLHEIEREARREQRSVLVTGESGVGKSTLVARFLEELRHRDPTAVILHGRCYEREAVPYKAFDDVVDALSEHLAALPGAEQRELLPDDAEWVAQVFPVLARVDIVARRTRSPVTRVSPHLLRGRVFQALRLLFARLAARAPLVVAIDDLHWSDADSLALLREVLRAPGAPRLFLLATLRADPAAAEATESLGGSVRTIALGALAPEEARALVERLLAGNGRTAETEGAIAAESEGHPLFLTELVRHALSPASLRPPSLARGTTRFEDALAARLRRLDPTTLETLSLVALADTPLTLAQAAHASRADLAELAARLSTLRRARLVLTTGPRSTDRVEPYHDRIRSAVLALVDEDTRPGLHRRLADAIAAEAPDDHETLARHCAAAGDVERGVHHALRAAETSTAAFAFHNAAAMYRQAIALLPEGSPRAGALQVELGRVLSWGGHGVDAAAAFLSAARTAEAGVSLELRRRAAEQLVSTGHLEDGVVLLREVTSEAGLPYPETATGAVASLLLQRARLRLRGIGFVSRDESTLPPRDLARIDVCWAAVVSLSMVDTVRGADFQARNLRLALDAGEPYRVCRALAWESAMEAAMGAYPRAKMLANAASLLAARLDTLQPRALNAACGATAAYLTGHWTEVRRLIAEVETISQQEWSDGARYELDNGRMLAISSLSYMGEVKQFLRERPALLAEAREGRNVHILTNLLSGMNVIHLLARGRVEEVVAELDETIACWSAGGMHIPHFVDLYGRVQAALHQGKGVAALALVDATKPGLVASFLLHGPYFRINVRDLAGRAAVAAAAASTGAARATYLRRADKEVRALAGERLAHWAGPLAHTIAAAAASVRGDAEGACERLARAATLFDAADMNLHAAAVRRRLGQLRGGDVGAAMVAGAEGWMRAQTVTEVPGIGAILVPGGPGASPWT